MNYFALFSIETLDFQWNFRKTKLTCNVNRLFVFFKFFLMKGKSILFKPETACGFSFQLSFTWQLKQYYTQIIVNYKNERC